MFGPIDSALKKVFGTSTERAVKKVQPIVNAVGALEPQMQALSDDELRALAPVWKQKIENGASLDDLLVEVFAGVREASVRTLGMRPFDVQIIGGVFMHEGTITEMKTGEGKTLVATLPVTLNGLPGKGVHVVTVNDYLADRDADWMRPVYNMMGLTVGKVLSKDSHTAESSRIKRAAYQCGVTYGTNNEFGFDYLRDNMKYRIEEYVQRGHNFVIIDEVDSILIDEARTPLIISGPTNFPIDRYYLIDAVVPLLQNELDYNLDEKSKQVHLTDAGVDKVENKLGVDNLYDTHNMEILHHVNQALRAHTIFKRDRDYVVKEGKVVIVDEHTGRLMVGRRWSDGLHQAIEAKEKLTVEAESQTYATITFQNYFRMYDKLAGMTGTAETEAAEFAKIYDVDTVVIPTNVPLERDDEHDIVYRYQEEKFRAVIEDIQDCHERGQPVLLGTTSVEKSEIVARMLEREKIPFEILNAKNHAREAHIVAQAGRLGRVTISTNMAGRGTDIKLGGNPDELAKDLVDPNEDLAGWEARANTLRVETDAEKVKVMAAGGLRVIGTERHESRRIDNQLRGRSGRQGEPGSSKFYMSLEDDLLRIFGSDKILAFMEKWNIEDDEPISHRWITRSIENAQKKVEGHHFNVRKNLLEYDDVLNQQRQYVYDLRRKALSGESIREMMIESVEGVADDMLDDCAGETIHPEDWDIKGLRERLERIFELTWEEDDAELRDFAWSELRDRIIEGAMVTYEAKEEELGEETCRRVERDLVLQFTDSLWKDHLLAMDRLRQGVSLRGYGQRNPLLEYKKDGFNMFMLMNALRDERVFQRLRTITAEELDAVGIGTKRSARRLSAGNMSLPRQPDALPSAPAQPAPAKRPPKGPQAHAFGLVRHLRRNDPCPCGSGQKFKKCCQKVALPMALKAEVDKVLEAQDVALAKAKAEAEEKLAQMKAEADAAAANNGSVDAAPAGGLADGAEGPEGDSGGEQPGA